MSAEASVLRAAAALLSLPGRWTQKAWARNADGKYRTPLADDAVCFCLRGAIARTVGSYLPEHTAPYERYVREAIGRRGLAVWNDAEERRLEDVLWALDLAAELAERVP